MLTIFRPIFVVLFAPFRWLDKLFRHKDNLLEYHLNYGPSAVKIDTKIKGAESDDLLIAGYVLFLARYFYICDERQALGVRITLENCIGEIEPNLLPVRVWEAAKQTFNKMEFQAIYGLFTLGNPPLGYSIDDPSRSYAKYSFVVWEQRGHLTSRFHMSAGPDIVLLPLTVGVLYNYVADKLSDRSKKELLDKTVMDLLEAYHSEDCRSQYALWKLPVEILAKNGIGRV